MSWIDYRNAYDLVSHSLIVEMLRMVKVAEIVEGLLCGSMDDWKVVFTSIDDVLDEFGIKHGILQWILFSFSLFMVPLKNVIKEREERE